MTTTLSANIGSAIDSAMADVHEQLDAELASRAICLHYTAVRVPGNHEADRRTVSMRNYARILSAARVEFSHVEAAVARMLGDDSLPETFLKWTGQFCRDNPSVTNSAIAERLTPEVFQAQYEACQKAIVTLEEAMTEADPDVVVIVGDDQEELFFDDNMPLFSIYWGDTMHLSPRTVGENAPPAVKASMWGYGDVEMDVPVDSELGLHLIQSLIEDDFDIAQSRYLNAQAGGTVGPLGYLKEPVVTERRPQAMRTR